MYLPAMTGAARREADLLGVKLTGTIGILLKAIKRKVIKKEEADDAKAHDRKRSFIRLLDQ